MKKEEAYNIFEGYAFPWQDARLNSDFNKEREYREKINNFIHEVSLDDRELANDLHSYFNWIHSNKLL